MVLGLSPFLCFSVALCAACDEIIVRPSQNCTELERDQRSCWRLCAVAISIWYHSMEGEARGVVIGERGCPGGVGGIVFKAAWPAALTSLHGTGSACNAFPPRVCKPGGGEGGSSICKTELLN